MAAFSNPHPSFVFDTFLVPTTSNNMSSSAEEGTIISTKTFYSPIYSNEYLQEIPLLPQFHESSCYDVQLPFSCASTDHDPISLTAKQDYSVSSPIVVEPVSGDHHQLSTPDHQGVNKLNPVENKRKKMDVKVEREGKGEKERKCNGSLRKLEERKITKVDSKKQKKVAEKAPSGFVHVRARRGQATDSHSLAERVRREKISVRMKILQSLVPGCDKITGKALILDEIIKYVQTLQAQVEFLAAKLSFVNPVLNEFGVEFNTNTLGQETCCSDFQFPTVQESISTQLGPFFKSDQKTPIPNSLLLLDQEQATNAATFQDNGNSLWGTDGGRRHELVSHYGQLLRQQEKQNRSRDSLT